VRRTPLLACAIGAVAAGVIGAGIGAQSGAGGAAGPEISDALPRPVRPAFTPGLPRPPRPTRFVARWAPVQRAATARRAPGTGADPIARVATTTPEGTTNIVRVLGRRIDRGGRLWIRVSLATLPNGTTGWLPRDALGGYGTVDTRLVVDLRRLTATLLRHGRPIFRARVGVGQPRWPTPRGRFYIRNRLTRYAGPTYGPLAFGTSARSARFTDWPGGGFIGIHGTDEPRLIPGRISHGCIRMRNADIVALGRLLPVGTPLTIR
jgi:lipoprotein-anchoring transpeptidase ErfK/SrfK